MTTEDSVKKIREFGAAIEKVDDTLPKSEAALASLMAQVQEKIIFAQRDLNAWIQLGKRYVKESPEELEAYIEELRAKITNNSLREALPLRVPVEGVLLNRHYIPEAEKTVEAAFSALEENLRARAPRSASVGPTTLQGTPGGEAEGTSEFGLEDRVRIIGAAVEDPNGRAFYQGMHGTVVGIHEDKNGKAYSVELAPLLIREFPVESLEVLLPIPVPDKPSHDGYSEVAPRSAHLPIGAHVRVIDGPDKGVTGTIDRFYPDTDGGEYTVLLTSKLQGKDMFRRYHATNIEPAARIP